MKTIKRVFVNKGVELEYRRKLDKLVDGMNKSVMYWVLANLDNRTPKQMAKEIQKRIKQWKKVFGKHSETIAEWFVNSLYKHTIKAMQNAFKEADIKVKPKIPKKTVSAVYIENKNLIISIPEKYFEGVEVIAMLALLYGWDRERFKQELEKRHMIAVRRVKNIASDQSHKTTEVFKMAICSEAKIKYAKWQYTYLSKTPREHHIHMNGDLFDIEKGCYDIKEGEYIYPSEPVGCKCSFIPVIEEHGEDLRKEIETKVYYKRVARGY